MGLEETVGRDGEGQMRCQSSYGRERPPLGKLDSTMVHQTEPGNDIQCQTF